MSIPELLIREIRARPVVAPLPRPIRTASGDVMDAPLLLIDVLTDVGVTGRAYAFAYTPLTLRSLARLMLDFNQSQSTAGAVERIRRLQDFDLTWVEEPVAAEDLAGHRAVRERVRPVPIQTGENWWFPHGMASAIAAGASDLAMVDIMKIGGVTGWMAAMAQAEAAALPLSNHTFAEPSAHGMAVAPTASWFEYLDVAGAVLTERLLPVDGTITARGPGLGLDWDEHAVARYAFS
jgi:mandelate racemase